MEFETKREEDEELMLVRALVSAEESKDGEQLANIHDHILSLGWDKNRKKAVRQKQGQVKRRNSTVGMSEQDVLSIINTQAEIEHIVNFKIMLHESEGSKFFEGNENIAMDLDFWATACLRARRFRSNRAVQLLLNFAASVAAGKNVREKNIQDIIEEGVIVFLGEARCQKGRGIICIRMSQYDAKKHVSGDLIATIQRVVVNAIRQHPILQAIGFTIFFDLSNVAYGDYYSNLPKTLLNALEANLPFRYGDIVLVNAPMLFSVVFKVVKVFLNKKMRERLTRVNYKPDEENQALYAIASPDSLPGYLGGSIQVDLEQYAKCISETELVSRRF
mmetsp:Transcript_28172/g.45265  ORF Transcript_28172/g.45265 Transcript_28172/m.45265 type:complete len:333 (+) Transcript_28172:936-1934(+)